MDRVSPCRYVTSASKCRSGLKRRLGLWLAALAFAGAGCRPDTAQEIQLGDLRPADNAANRQRVEMLTDAVQVEPGKPEWVELRFRVLPGLHINSHTPKDELLVPTALDVGGEGQAKILAEQYPAGIPLRLEVGDGEVLSTYQGEFRVRVQLVAAPGESTLSGVLLYQACDARACFPPKKLPVKVAVAAR